MGENNLVQFKEERRRSGNKVGKTELVACIMSDGGLDDRGEWLLRPKYYFRWLRKVIGKRVLVIDRGMYEGREDWFNRLVQKTGMVFADEMGKLKEYEGENGLIILGERELYESYIEEVDYIRLYEIAGVVESYKYFPEFDLDKYDVVSMEDMDGYKFWGVDKVYRRR